MTASSPSRARLRHLDRVGIAAASFSRGKLANLVAVHIPAITRIAAAEQFEIPRCRTQLLN
jgi:hypothetical protein